jgi:hypothetical protein
MEMLKHITGTDMLHVPYRGSALAMQELATGRVDAFIIDFAPARPFMETGQARCLALTGTRRWPEFPDFQTFEEQGLPLNLIGWHALFVPAATPTPIVNYLAEEVMLPMVSPVAPRSTTGLSSAIVLESRGLVRRISLDGDPSGPQAANEATALRLGLPREEPVNSPVWTDIARLRKESKDPYKIIKNLMATDINDVALQECVRACGAGSSPWIQLANYLLSRVHSNQQNS